MQDGTESSGGLDIELPWPPSINHYYGNRRGGGKFIKPRGAEFRIEVANLTRSRIASPLLGRLSIDVQASPPNKARRDLDNLFKATLDAMQHAGVYADDCQFDRISIQRCEPIKGGKLHIHIRTIHP